MNASLPLKDEQQNMASKTSYFKSLKLNNFRSYESAHLKLDARHVVFTGPNGVGKTNLLEAISLIGPGRGMRRAKLEALAHLGGASASDFAIHAELEGLAGSVSIGTGVQGAALGGDAGRKFRMNGANIARADEVLEHLRLIWLTPAMDGLFTGPTADRRRFLDRLVVTFDPLHSRRVGDFDRALRARNRLLEERNPDPTWLGSIEQQIAELGSSIVMARLDYASALLGQIESSNSIEENMFPKASLELAGNLELAATQKNAADLESYYLEELSEGRAADKVAGRTLLGPHRSDLIVSYKDKAMPANMCSTGEQKALLIGLLLAHARLIQQTTGGAPILLLDEVAAHLDPERRAALFGLIDELGAQAWFTGTDLSLFEALAARAQYFTIVEGKIVANEFEHGI